jgi:phosphoglycolate phosphatase-like HAD superfamily hydrolase
MPKPIIALDADGVLLDYHNAYRSAWYKAFDHLPEIKDANAYWPLDRWDVRKLYGDELTHFRRFFDDKFWRTIPAIPGALDACNRLHDEGFELICVSALDPRFESARLDNLESLGFPIHRVIAIPNTSGVISPKAEVLNTLRPVAFVDDFLPYHRGVSQKIHRALITRETNGSPNIGDDLKEIDSIHNSLAKFAAWWLANSISFSS